MKSDDVLVLRKPTPIGARLKGVRFLSTRQAIDKILRGKPHRPTKSTTWLALDAESAAMLLDEVQTRRVRTFGTLAFLEDITPSRLALASRYFRTISQPGLTWLPPQQLIRILHSAEPAQRIVAGLIDAPAGNLLVYRGDLQPVVAPLGAFPPHGAIAPDFNDLEIIDWGNAVRFGKYEASTDSILYENDPAYRRWLRRQRHAKERTFGASLRRLRLQRALRQTDFEPEISAKTMARIENNQVTKPHGATLHHIAERLSVEPGEIESF